MILYTEQELKEAWHIHCAELVYSNSDSMIQIELPTLEQFRPIYEDQMEDLYHGHTS